MTAVEPDLDCRHAAKLLSLARERPLDGEERAALHRHLDGCSMFRNFASQLEFIGKAASRFRSG